MNQTVNLPSKFQVKQAKCFDETSSKLKVEELLRRSPAEKIEFDKIFALLGDLSNKRVLDLGCGRGRYAIEIAKRAKEVVGVDISIKSIDLARQAAEQAGVNNFQGLIDDFFEPFESAPFDYILAVNLLHHVDNLDLILTNIRKSLKPNGKIFILEFNPLNLTFIPFLIAIGHFSSHFNTKYFRSNIFTLRRYLERNRLKIIDLKRHSFLPTMLANYWSGFEKINNFLNQLPLIKQFCAFYIIVGQPGESGAIKK
ncbi:MAG: class I SAM-dependent methyltransferase [Patescibacteria group bacterium]|jgi:2-polyprenyl-3-methyl-5-hydroxy-6-metoxy-1,4-benzoquinol methylase